MTTPDTLPEYEGWRNYPTWAVNLWLSNDEGLYNDARRIANAEPPQVSYYYSREDHLRDYVEELIGPDSDKPAGLGGDILTWALGHVDWPAVVSAFREK